ncbi:hypothetical protein [Microvirga pakistanensis]|nr:hypothetical protein [Microvirga pakistanensis]
MARGEKRGNREAKKPKQDKPRNPIPASPFVSQGKGSVPAKLAGGKKTS